MEEILQQVESAIRANLPFPALVCALMLPDICGAAESSDGLANRQRYCGWVDGYLAPKYSGRLDGKACYYLRCSLLHVARATHGKSPYSRIVFVASHARNGSLIHNNILNGALNLDIERFCRDMVASVREWLVVVGNRPTVAANCNNMIHRYGGGHNTYVRGVEVIT